MKKFINEERAQSGAVFRLLIDSIIGLAILMIILSAMANFYEMRLKTSTEEFRLLVKNATDTPNGAVVESGSLVFKSGSGFSQAMLSSNTGLDGSCFSFQTGLSGVDVGDGSFVKFIRDIETKIYSKCNPTGKECDAGEESCCEIECIVSVGKKLSSDNSPSS